MPVSLSKISQIFNAKHDLISGFVEAWRRIANRPSQVATADFIHDLLTKSQISNYFATQKTFGLDLPRSPTRKTAAALLIPLSSTAARAAGTHSSHGKERFSRELMSGVVGLGIAAVLAAVQEQLPANVKLIFLRQRPRRGDPIDPEILSGVQSIHSFNLTETLTAGHVGIKKGAIFPAKAPFKIRLTSPAETETARAELVQAAARLTLILRQTGSRRFDPLMPAQVLVSALASGEKRVSGLAFADIAGTFQTMYDSRNGEITAMIRETTKGIAGPRGLRVGFGFEPGFPAVMGDSELAEDLFQVAGAAIGASRTLKLQYQRNCDDCLARHYQQVRGTVLNIGWTNKLMAASSGEDFRRALWPALEAGVKVTSAFLSLDRSGLQSADCADVGGQGSY